MLCANNLIHYDQKVIFVRLFALIIIIMKTYLKVLNFNMLVKYILLNMCLRLSQFSQSSLMKYMELCVLSLSVFL